MMKKSWKATVVLMAMAQFAAMAQEIINLYPGTILNAKANAVKETYATGMYRGVTVPTLEIFLPEKEKATGTAVIICPGGGYSVVVYQGEGISTAKELTRKGIAAFVLKYRLPDDTAMRDKKNGPLQDAQQAIKIVRENAATWGISPERIGIMGFSAGGHLASTAATQFHRSIIKNNDSTSLRPDFQILVYPVISMQDNLTHHDSRTRLLGTQPPKELIDLFSNELQVNENTPPAFITHAADDRLVDVDNSILYFEALRHHGVAVEMHIYPKGGHGFIFKHEGWTEPLFKWIENSILVND